MTFVITDPSARSAINAAIAEFSLTGDYSQAYQAVVDALTETIVDPETGTITVIPREGVDLGALAWIGGAAQVNGNVGPFAQYIRGYTSIFILWS